MKPRPAPAPARVATDAENVVPRGAKGLERQRLPGDAVKRYLQARRPNGECVERWVNYRTEACLGYNTAFEKGAPADVLDLLKIEYEAAVAALTIARPETDWYTLERREPAPASAPSAAAPLQLALF